MYEELVQALRNCVLGNPCELCPYYRPTGPTEKCSTMNVAAADAIEELSMKLHGDEAAIVGMKREIERMVVAGRPRWIPVTEGLPEAFKHVIVNIPGMSPHPTVQEAFREKNGMWYSNGFRYGADEITHWMPLPEPPKEEERSFCADCAWHDPERQRCSRESEAENCVLWEPNAEPPEVEHD